MTIQYSGWNEKGTAEVLNTINYVGSNNTVSKFLDSVSYRIKPNKNLKNGDTIQVTLVYVESEKELANVEFTQESKTYTVNGLTELNERTVVKENEIVVDDDGNESISLKEYYVVNGVKIPSEWNLSEDEIEAYITYIQYLEENEAGEETSIDVNWMQGTSEKATSRKSANFYFKDYLNNANTTYNDAYNFGINSSQEFKIDPILEDETTIGYRVVFREDTNE